MKTFDEKDLITWSNRNKAVIGNEYYFANVPNDIEFKIKHGVIRKLNKISNENYAYPFTDDDDCYFACVLPVDAVRETEPEKKYRPLKNAQELEDFFLKYFNKKYDNILGSVFRLNSKNDDKVIDVMITKITHTPTDIYVNGFSGYTLLTEYDIFTKCGWTAFGVEDEN